MDLKKAVPGNWIRLKSCDRWVEIAQNIPDSECMWYEAPYPIGNLWMVRYDEIDNLSDKCES
jgi:hypothetical protein